MWRTTTKTLGRTGCLVAVIKGKNLIKVFFVDTHKGNYMEEY